MWYSGLRYHVVLYVFVQFSLEILRQEITSQRSVWIEMLKTDPGEQNVKDWTELQEKVSETDYVLLKRQFLKTGDIFTS